ncbi:MAG: hypothetical protein ABIH82_05325 [Candidatus Woesearchaeota archaeon]
MDSNNIIGIKAGSSVFGDEQSYASVARLIAPLTRSYNHIFFVVSAVKGATDQTIDTIARETGEDYQVSLNELNRALRGDGVPYTGRFNNSDIAARLVQPEGRSVENLVRELHKLGVNAVGIEHGQEYPLVGTDNSQYLYATPDMTASIAQRPDYDAQVVVVPGFGVRSPNGEVMCTGRGSSDLTLTQFGEVYGLPEVIYWKGTDNEGRPVGGFRRNSDNPEEGIFDEMDNELARKLGGKILDARVYDFAGKIRITLPGRVDGGTLIYPPLKRAA